MMTGPGNEVPAAAGSPGYLRASHADREQVIDTVKAAFVKGRLTMGELDVRVGQALAARTHAELAAVTAGIPAGSDLARPPKPARAQPQRPGNRLVNPGVCVITATTLAAGIWAGLVAGAAAAVIVAIFMLNLAALATRPLPRSRQITSTIGPGRSGPRPKRAPAEAGPGRSGPRPKRAPAEAGPG